MMCSEARQLMCEYLDERLLGEAGQNFEFHLAACPSCAEEVKQLREMLAWLKQAEEVEPPADLRQKVLRELEQEKRARHFRFAPGFAQAVAAAAVLLIMVAGNWQLAGLPQGLAPDMAPQGVMMMESAREEAETMMLAAPEPAPAADETRENEAAEEEMNAFAVDAQEKSPLLSTPGEGESKVFASRSTPPAQPESNVKRNRLMILFNAVLAPLLAVLVWLAYKKRKEAW